jgi:hypothetical protein
MNLDLPVKWLASIQIQFKLLVFKITVLFLLETATNNQMGDLKSSGWIWKEQSGKTAPATLAMVRGKFRNFLWLQLGRNEIFMPSHASSSNVLASFKTRLSFSFVESR